MVKRRLIQLFAAVIYNADVRSFLTGGISRSAVKKVCVPGLNCYSCPSAVSSCPLGSLQNTIGGGHIPFFLMGFFLLIGALLGRAVCGFLCPFGLIQELLNRGGSALRKVLHLPEKKRDYFWKNSAAGKLSRKASIIKYVFLAVLVIGLPLAMYINEGIGSPYFCSWICPAGTLEAGIPLVIMDENLRGAIGFLFGWKTVLLILLVVWSVCAYRPFCRYICPLGAVYSFFNRIAVLGVRVDADKCIQCGRCVSSCRMDTLSVNDRECIRCGDCIQVCPKNAISIDMGPATGLYGGLKNVRKKNA